MTLDKRVSAELERPIESIDDLVAYFRAGEKPRERFRIGIEHEKLALRAGSLEPVPYDGENGIEAFLRRVAAQPGFETIVEDGRVMGLDGPRQRLARAGRSGRAERQPAAAPARRHRGDRGASRAAAARSPKPSGIVLLGLGAHPFHPTKELTQIPRDRYRIMRRYLPTSRRAGARHDARDGDAAGRASTGRDEADMIVEAANGARRDADRLGVLRELEPASRASPSGFVSRRAWIWHHTDPDRCGLLPFAFDAGLRLPALRRVGARRADVLPGPRRPLSRDGGQDLPSLLARRPRGRARDARRLGSPPDDAVPRGAPEAHHRGARRRRGPDAAARRGCRRCGRGSSTTRVPGAAATALLAARSRRARGGAARRGAARPRGRIAAGSRARARARARRRSRARACARAAADPDGERRCSIRSTRCSSGERAPGRSCSSAGRASGTLRRLA